jgi:hypothetical protein
LPSINPPAKVMRRCRRTQKIGPALRSRFQSADIPSRRTVRLNSAALNAILTPAPTRRSGQGVDQGWRRNRGGTRAVFLQWAQKNLSFADRIRLKETGRTYRDTTRDFEQLNLNTQFCLASFSSARRFIFPRSKPISPLASS